MSQASRRIVNEVPKGFWKKMRTYDEALYVASKEHVSTISDGRVKLGWQWQTDAIEASSEAIIARPVHVLWWPLRSLGGLVAKGGMRVTEAMADPHTPFHEHEKLAGISKVFAYSLTPRFLGASILFGSSYLAAFSATHENLHDTLAWNQEAIEAGETTVAEGNEMGDLLVPTPEDYDLILEHMEFGVENSDRRPVYEL